MERVSTSLDGLNEVNLSLKFNNIGEIMNGLGTRRYTELADKLSYTLGLLQTYLELKIKKLEKELTND